VLEDMEKRAGTQDEETLEERREKFTGVVRQKRNENGICKAKSFLT